MKTYPKVGVLPTGWAPCSIQETTMETMETMEFEVSWHGAAWREVPAPPMLEPTQTPTRVRGARGRTSVLRVVGEGWISLHGVVARSGVSERKAWDWLVRLVEDGRIERLTVPSGYNVPQHLYRRTQVAEQAV